MSTLRLVVPGDPVPQPRHRVGKPGDGPRRAYIKSSHPVHGYKERVAGIARMKAGNRDPYDGPLAVEILFLIARPPSYKKSARHEFQPKKPDIDNLAKAALDAMKGIIYTDDSLIVSARFMKVTARSGVSAATYITFRAVDDAHETVTEFLTAFTS